MCYLAPPRHSSEEKGFSLIEAAIVLGVVGIVIGGIWYSAASVQQSQRINDTAAGILQIAQGARRLFSHSDYPTANNTATNVTSTAAASGLLPGDFKYISGQTATSPMGAGFSVALSCYGATGSFYCPMLQIAFTGPANSVNPGTLTTADCIQLIRRFAGLVKISDDFLYVQIVTPTNPGFLYLYPPINPASVTCPADTSHVNLWFRP